MLDIHCIYRAITNFGERKGPGKKKKKRDLPAEVLARLPPSVPTSDVSSIAVIQLDTGLRIIDHLFLKLS